MFHLRRELSVEEQREAELMENTLLPLQPNPEVADRWCWTLDISSSYQVKSTYSAPIIRTEEFVMEEEKRLALQSLWKTEAPSKYLIHAWRVLLNFLPTRVALERRGVNSFNF